MSADVKVEKVGDRIALVSPGMHWESGRDLARSIPGGRWEPNSKRWMFPLDFRICQEVRKATDHWEVSLGIGPELTEWAKAEKARLAEIPDPNEMELIEIERLKSAFPLIWSAIETRPFQTVGVDFISKRKNVLLADDPGLGKTLQTIGAIVNSFDDGLVLVVAPKSAANITWPAEIQRWSPDDTVINLASLATYPAGARRNAFLEEADRQIAETPGRVWVITTPYWIQVKADKDSRGEFKRDDKKRIVTRPKLPLLMGWEWDAVIVDESHKVVICNTAKRSKHTQTRFGLDELSYTDRAMKIAISGTPMRGKSENMWGTLNWLEPKIYTSYWKWMERNFKEYEDYSGFGSGKVYDGLKNEKEFYDGISHLFIRRTKQEVASDLPSKMYGGEPLFDDGPVGVWLDMLPGQDRIYAQMVKDGETEEGIIANGILSEWTRLKQFASATCTIDDDGKVVVTNESNKLEWVKEFLDDRGIYDDANNKVIIASQFSSLIDMFESELNKDGIRTFKLTGATKDADRQKAQNEFQNDPNSPKVFLLTTTAGGVSLTLDAADDVIILDETWIPDDQLQVEDRAHRLSRPDHNVTIWYVRSKVSIEEDIAKVTGGRESELRGIMDKSRGVELRRQIKKEMEKKWQ